MKIWIVDYEQAQSQYFNISLLLWVIYNTHVNYTHLLAKYVNWPAWSHWYYTVDIRKVTNFYYRWFANFTFDLCTPHFNICYQETDVSFSEMVSSYLTPSVYPWMRFCSEKSVLANRINVSTYLQSITSVY